MDWERALKEGAAIAGVFFVGKRVFTRVVNSIFNKPDDEEGGPP